jgi:hypothetical protein
MGPRLASASSSAGSPDSGQAGPALELRNVLDRKSSIWSLRFSKTKRGYLGALANNGHFKAYDLAKEYLSEENRHSVDETLGHGSSANYPEQIYTKNVRDIRYPFDHPTRGCLQSDRVVSFDFLNMSASNEPSALTLLSNGKLEILTVQPPCPPVRLSSQSVLVRGRRHADWDFDILSPRPRRNKTHDVVRALRERISVSHPQQNGTSDRPETKSLSSRESREKTIFLSSSGATLDAQDALTFLTLTRSRCQEGYLFDCEKNKQIVADDPDLQEFWAWVQRKSFLREYNAQADHRRLAGSVC